MAGKTNSYKNFSGAAESPAAAPCQMGESGWVLECRKHSGASSQGPEGPSDVPFYVLAAGEAEVWLHIVQGTLYSRDYEIIRIFKAGERSGAPHTGVSLSLWQKEHGRTVLGRATCSLLEAMGPQQSAA